MKICFKKHKEKKYRDSVPWKSEEYLLLETATYLKMCTTNKFLSGNF